MMTRLKTAGLGVCFSLLGSTALWADVTAEQVWDAWSQQYAAYGYDMTTAGTEKSGDTLVVSGVQMKSETPEASFDMLIPEVRLRELGDGTVEVRVSPEIKAEADAKSAEDAQMQMAINIRQANAVTIVSGTPENLSYDVTAPEIVVDLDQTVLDGDKNVPVKLWLSISGVSGKYQVQDVAGQKVDSNVAISGIKMTASGADPDGSGTFALDGQLADLKLQSAMAMPEGVTMEDMPAALAAGLSMSMNASYGASSYSVDAEAPEGATKLAGAAQQGRLNFALSPEGVVYQVANNGTTMEMTSPQLPMPLSAALDQVNVDFALPLSKSDAAQPFTGKIGLVGLTVSDEIWGMFDPTAQLPRDPATLVIDLTGKMRPTMDLFSPESAAQPMPPVEVETLDINRVQLTLAGADLTGKGALSFDNSMGMPMPLGAIDLKLVGANGLMDKLVTMGLMPQDQAMFARMMMGLYAVPAGEDEMTSKIEFKEGGEILANGQRIQ
jgi:hypothetical protein